MLGHSVFTHLDEPRQDAWLGELQRVTSPGGLLVLSTDGEVALGDDVWRIRERLEDEGIVFIDDVFGPEYTLPDWYQRTFHAPLVRVRALGSLVRDPRTRTRRCSRGSGPHPA